MKIAHHAYAGLYGPTTGDRVRLADTDLFLEIERVFSIRFSAVETTSLKNVGELVTVIEKKTRR